MAAAVFTRTPAPYLNRLENFDTQTLLRIGLGAGIDITDAERALGHTPDSARRDALSLATKGYAEKEYAMSADTNDAGIINLTDDLLVDFLTASRSRRIDFEAYLKADVDQGFIVGEALVACAATPIVASLPVSFTDDDGLADATELVRAVLPGDTATATCVLSQSSNDVILTVTGVANIDTRWVVKVRIYPQVTLPLIATT